MPVKTESQAKLDFLKKFPGSLSLYKEDFTARKELIMIRGSICFDVVSSEMKISLERSLRRMNTAKHKLLNGHNTLKNYERSVLGLKEEIGRVNKFVDLYFCQEKQMIVNLFNLEQTLLNLPSDCLRKLMISVINKTGIVLVDEEKSDRMDVAHMAAKIDQLEEIYGKVRLNLSLKERRFVKNSFEALRNKHTLKTNRAILNFKNRLSTIETLLSK
ncbi:hypothetical protein HXX01_04250 [Candidatus Nomurabacteria bacterium]|nr:hypothetical protein [Candidatus Nomurabacteria bacterium]